MREQPHGEQPRAAFPSSTGDVWTRLARLHGLCEVSLESLSEPGAGPHARLWSMTIRRRESPQTPPVTVLNKRAVEAIGQAIDIAEGQGWHLADSRARSARTRAMERSPLEYRPIFPRDFDPPRA